MRVPLKLACLGTQKLMRNEVSSHVPYFTCATDKSSCRLCRSRLLAPEGELRVETLRVYKAQLTPSVELSNFSSSIQRRILGYLLLVTSNTFIMSRHDDSNCSTSRELGKYIASKFLPSTCGGSITRYPNSSDFVTPKSDQVARLKPTSASFGTSKRK